jgi:hypothetical protein
MTNSASTPKVNALDYVRSIAPYQAGKPIEELAREFGLAPESIVKLASNENPLGMPASARAAMLRAADLGRYPDANGFELKAKLSARFGVPDACTGCHRDQQPAWAEARLKQWYGRLRTDRYPWTEAFAAARAHRPEAERLLLSIVGDAGQPGIVRATALHELPRPLDRPAAEAASRGGFVPGDRPPRPQAYFFAKKPDFSPCNFISRASNHRRFRQFYAGLHSAVGVLPHTIFWRNWRWRRSREASP